MNQLKKWQLTAGIMLAAGLAGAVSILFGGEGAMGSSANTPWPALIAIYEFFAASSVGLTLLASLWFVFRLESFKPIAQRALVLAIVTLLGGFAAVGLELGNPLNMFWIILSPNITSPIWWMGAFYGLYLTFMLVTLFNIIKNNEKYINLFSKLAFIAGLAAIGNLGSVFGNLLARPFWHGPALPIYFVISAFMSGIALLVIALYLVEKSGLTTSLSGQLEPVMTLLGKLLALAAGLVMFFTFWKTINALYGGAPGKYEAAMALIAGPLALNFWLFEIALGLVIPFLLIVNAKQLTPNLVFKAGIMSIAGIFFMRYDLVAAGQIVPLKVVEGIKFAGYHAFKTPWPEWAVLIGAIGGIILLFSLAESKLQLDQSDKM